MTEQNPTTELVPVDQAADMLGASLRAQMDYARAVSAASIIPDAYRGKPADVMIAVSLGQSMGLTPAESLYRIAVIKGKPSASAELIAANVRKAGHRLRVRIDDQALSVSAQIIRADDPEFPFTVTRDMEWARQMGLANGDNYKKQPLTMLQWRAITACARLACPEALYGVAHTPDELLEGEQGKPAAAPSSQVDRMRAALQVEQVPTPPAAGPDLASADDVVEGRARYADTPGGHADRRAVADEQPAPEPATEEPPADTPPPAARGGRARQQDTTPGPMTRAQQSMLFGQLASFGIDGDDRDERLRIVSTIVGRRLESMSGMSKDEASRVIDELSACTSQHDLAALLGSMGQPS